MARWWGSYRSFVSLRIEDCGLRIADLSFDCIRNQSAILNPHDLRFSCLPLRCHDESTPGTAFNLEYPRLGGREIDHYGPAAGRNASVKAESLHLKRMRAVG